MKKKKKEEKYRNIFIKEEKLFTENEKESHLDDVSINYLVLYL